MVILRYLTFSFVPSVFTLSSHRAECVCAPSCTRMVAKGFGKEPDSKDIKARIPSGAEKARDAAAQRLEEMRAQGLPEFSVWVRLVEEKTDPEQPDFPWLPVGSLCVPRSSSICKAIYDVEEDLVKGVYRLFPNMKGKEFELGWQNKEFTDEDIQVAKRPVLGLTSPIQSFLSKIWPGKE